MNTATTLLHDMRSQQLRALHEYGIQPMAPMDIDAILRLARLCGAQYDTRNLSDKSLEEIDTLSGKYLDRVR